MDNQGSSYQLELMVFTDEELPFAVTFSSDCIREPRKSVTYICQIINNKTKLEKLQIQQGDSFTNYINKIF